MENEYVLALDISSTCTGVCLMNLEGKLIELTFCSPKVNKNIIDPTMEKADIFEEYILRYKDLKLKHIFIEAPLDRSSNAFTVVKLAKFNGIISRIVYEIFNIKPQYISVYEWRKLFFPELVSIKGNKQVLSFPKDSDKKDLVWKKVAWMEPHVNWFYSKFFKIKTENYDMADSYGVCRAGLIMNGFLPNPIEEKFGKIKLES